MQAELNWVKCKYAHSLNYMSGMINCIPPTPHVVF